MELYKEAKKLEFEFNPKYDPKYNLTHKKAS